MTYSYNNKNKQIPLSEESVFSYLSANPNFLVQNHSLLKEISIPHLLDENTSSLIEYQVKVLRDENNKLKNNIEENQSNNDFGIDISVKPSQLGLKFDKSLFFDKAIIP